MPRKAVAEKPLTDRQERFIHEYLLDQNASAAAARAGYSARNKGGHVAQLMKDPRVMERIALGLQDLYARLDFNAVALLKAQLRAAYFDPAKLFDADEEPIPLDQLDEETLAGVVVSYSRRRGGEHVRHVRQVSRLGALNILQRRMDNFERLQREVFAAGRVEEVAEEQQRRAPGILEVPLRLEVAQAPVDAPEEVALGHTAADIAPAQVAQVLDEGAKQAGEPLADPIPTLSLPLKGRGPSAEVVKEAGKEGQPVLAKAFAEVGKVAAKVAAKVRLAAEARVAASADGEGPPPSPFEPGYDFKKDPNAMYGGRFTAWNKYWREKREQELMKAEKQAALLNPPPNFRVGPGRTVPVRMEPGYNPPWLRNNRQEYAIGAGECWID